MGRLLTLLLIGIFIYSLVRNFQRRRPPAPPPADSFPATEDMVRCAHCGIHLPRSESLLSQQRTFCCAEHRDADHS